MNTKDLVQKAFDAIDPEKESLMVFYVDKDGKPKTYVAGEAAALSAVIATNLDNGLDEKSSKQERATGGIILNAIKAVLAIPNMQGMKLALELTSALVDAVKNSKKNVRSAKDLAKPNRKERANRQHNVDDEEDCSTCKANKVCPLPQAIKYRKENGIPAPAKRKNGKK